MTKQMWTGRLRVVQRGMEAAVMLIDRRDGKLFAMCQVEKGAVERVPDSSRYFVIKIKNAQGRHAFVGLAFNDRNEAFDFNVALQEFNKDVERGSMLEKQQKEEDTGPEKDFSLKQGEKIKIAIGGKTSTRPKKSGLGGTGSSGFTLAPPPGDASSRKMGGGGGGLLVPPPGDSRRAQGVKGHPMPRQGDPGQSPVGEGSAGEDVGGSGDRDDGSVDSGVSGAGVGGGALGSGVGVMGISATPGGGQGQGTSATGLGMEPPA
ncbi:unnamed protein product, partial [Discosporangium mesarthrocarpum]